MQFIANEFCKSPNVFMHLEKILWIGHSNIYTFDVRTENYRTTTRFYTIIKENKIWMAINYNSYINIKNGFDTCNEV